MSQEMKGFVGITDDDPCAFLCTAATFTKNTPPEGRRVKQPEAGKP